MNRLLVEVGLALTSLKNALGFSVAVISTLGITLAALITVFSLNHLLLVQALPYPDADRLAVLQGMIKEGPTTEHPDLHTYPGAIQILKENQQFDDIGLIYYEEAVISNIVDQTKVHSSYVSAGFFKITGAPMAMGRGFGATEALDTKNPVTVLSYQTWQQQFEGRTDILEQKVVLGDVSYRVIGVTAQNFAEPRIFESGWGSDVWLPWDFNPSLANAQDYTNFAGNLLILGRLKPQISHSQASQTLSSDVNKAFKEATTGISYFKDSNVVINVLPLEQVIVGDSRSTVLMMLAGAVALLLIACANVSNLMFSRIVQKQRQFAIQAAVGAHKKHLFAMIFIENCLLMLFASTLAIVLTVVSQQWIVANAIQYLPRVEELTLNTATLAFAFLIALLLAALFASLTLRRVNYGALITMIQSSGKGTGLQISPRVRQLLVISQASMATVLLVASLSILNQSFQTVNQSAGFNTEENYYLSLNTGGRQYSSGQRIQIIAQMKKQLGLLPEVKMVSNSLFTPMRSRFWVSVLAQDAAGNNRNMPNSNMIDEKYFDLLEIPFSSGRNFTEEEARGGLKSLIVNQTLAKKMTTGGNVVGTRVYWNSEAEPYEVVGVVDDITLPNSGEVSRIYGPRTMSFNFMLKVVPGQKVNRQAVINVVNSIDRQLKVFELVSLADSLTELKSRDIFVSWMTLVLTILTGLLTGIGIYGVLSYSIKLRTYELGVRMAIGASPKHIEKLVLRDSGTPVVVGLLIGTALIGIGYFSIGASLSNHFQLGLMPFVITVAIVGVVCAFAFYVPTYKVSRRRPIHALRGN